jgi:Ca2+-binding RTX toxin-like protein
MASYISNWSGDFSTATSIIDNKADVLEGGMSDAFIELAYAIDAMDYGYIDRSSSVAHYSYYGPNGYGTFEIQGTSINTAAPVVTKMTISVDDLEYVFSCDASTTTSTIINKLVITDTANDTSVTAVMQGTLGNSTMSVSSLTYTAADGATLVLNGTFTFNLNSHAFTGNVSNMYLKDASDHNFTLSGISGFDLSELNDPALYPTYYDFVEEAMAGDDTVTGNSSANVLKGFGGNDTLDGGAGADTLIGGTGNDTYFVDNVADTITELASEG